MKLLNKILGVGALALASLTFSPKKAEACSSAIPIGRGGTNIAVADGASAVYWNPAGLIQLEGPELDVTVSPDNRYKAFLCYAQPLDEKTAVGINLTYRKIEFTDNASNTYWIKFSGSRKLSDRLSIGTNLTFLKRGYTNEVLPEVDEEKIHLSMDLGFLFKYNDKIKLGLLLQQDHFSDDRVNVRPGASLKLDDKTLLVVEGYDATNSYINSSWFKFGLERKVNDKFSLRTGAMIGDRIVPALGASYKKGNLETSIGYFNDVGTSHTLITLNKKF